jgi:hypothetical protein
MNEVLPQVYGYSKRAKWVINLTAALAGVNFLAFAHPRK